MRTRYSPMIRAGLAIAVSMQMLSAVGSAANRQGTRSVLRRVGLSWIAEDIALSDPVKVSAASQLQVKGEGIVGYFQRIDHVKNADGTPKYTRQSAARMILNRWINLRDKETTVSSPIEEKSFVDKDDGRLIVDRLSVKVTRNSRTIQGVAYIIKRNGMLIVALFATEYRVAAVDGMIKTLEQVGKAPKIKTK